MHAYEQREREKQVDFMPFNCGEDRVGSSLPKLRAAFKTFAKIIKGKVNKCVCNWIPTAHHR